MTSTDFFTGLLKDIKIDLTEEFDRNFERQAFFDSPWTKTKLRPGDNTLNKHGGAGLRGSIRGTTAAQTIKWESSLPYASIHNNGGVVVITAKMKRFFWAMYYKSSGAVSKKETGGVRNNKRNASLLGESLYWKALALKKVGDKLIIPKRQFIGTHQNVKNIIKQNTEQAILRLGEQFKTEFQKAK